MKYKVYSLLKQCFFGINNICFPIRYISGFPFLFFLFFFAETTTLSAQSESGNSEILTVKQALDYVGASREYTIIFNEQDVDLTKRVVINFQNKTIYELLDVILKEQPLDYKINNRTVHIWHRDNRNPNQPRAGTLHISGKVTDDNDGQVLVGCNVRIKDKNIAAITDLDGIFSLNAEKDDVLIFSYVGYETKQIKVISSSRMDMKLSSNSLSFEDVVITGYQKIKRYNVTGAVNTVKSRDIELRSANSLKGILEGSVPGLTVYNNQYRIRGGASLNSGSSPLFIVDDFEVEELPENMDMVESITILKDASAAAIWGSRAANGVVVITTKKGKADDFHISYSGNLKVGSQPNFGELHRANSKQIIDYDRDIFLGGYYFKGFFNNTKMSLSQEIISDYLEEDINDLTKQQLEELDSRLAVLATNNNRKQIEDNLLRKSLQHHNMLSIYGGSDKVNYFLSGSFIGGHSSYLGNSNKSININSRTSYKILPFLTLRSDVIANFENNDNGYTSLINDIYNLYPFQMLLNDANSRIVDYSNFNHGSSDKMVSQYGYYDQGKNILDEIDLANNKTNGVNYKVRIGSDFKAIDGLNITADYQYEKSSFTHKNIISKKSYYGRELINSMAVPNTENQLTYNIPNADILDHKQSTTDAWILKLGATLNRSFGVDKQHYVNAVAGFEMRSRHNYSETYRKLGYDDQVLSWQPINAILLENGVKWWDGRINRYNSTSYDGFSDILNREVSYFLSTIYTYDNRYTISGTMRIDESNLFGAKAEYRRNPIWSLGANWNIKNEKFFTWNFFSTLMLRASCGLTGNFDRSGSTTPIMVGRRIYVPAVENYVVRLDTPPNPRLRWERNRSTNLSIDIGFFNRINTTFTYYNNYCYDLLGSTLLDPTTGYSNARVNSADMTNTGIEFQLGADILKLPNFNWNINWVFAHNKNKITNNKINENDPQLDRVTGVTNFVEGYAREAIWSYRWAGLDNKGEPMVYDKEGNKTYDIAILNADDLEYSGTYQPKYNGSFSTTLQYKNLQAMILFTYNFGHVFRAEYPSMDAYEVSPSLTEKIADRWKNPGDENSTDIPRLPSVEDNRANTQHRSYPVLYSSNTIRSGNMIRLNEILLSYKFPQNWLKNIPLSRLSLTAQLNNIWLWTKNNERYDPEALSPLTGNMSFSQPLSFTAGIKVDF